MQENQKNFCRESKEDRWLMDASPAMAYVPWQEFKNTYEKSKALQAGTIFPELCKPFCGRRFGK